MMKKPAWAALLFGSLACQSVESFDDPREWTKPELVDSAAPTALRPQVAFDIMGHAIVVWDQTDAPSASDDETSDDIWWNQRDTPVSGDWGEWGAPVRLDHPEENEPCDSIGPQIGVGGDGSVIVVFAHDSGTDPLSCPARFGIWALRRDPKGEWDEAPQCIDAEDCAPSTTTANHPRVAVDSEGNALVVWQQSNPKTGTAEVWGNRFTPGLPWNTADAVAHGAPLSQRPEIAMDDRGNALIVWEQVDDTQRSSVWSKRVDADGNLRTEEPLEKRDDSDAFDVQLAGNFEGYAVAVWQQKGEALAEILANRYDPVSEEWEPRPTRIDPGHDDDPERPQVSINADGDAVVVWAEAGFRGSIWSSRATNRGDWERAVRIGPLGLGAARQPQVAANDQGDVIAVWTQFDGEVDSIWSNQYTEAQGWGISKPIARSLERVRARGPQVALDPQGNPLVVWVSGELRGIDILASRLVTPVPE